MVALAGCAQPVRGINLINRTDVPLAIGFSRVVAPCSEAFLSEDEINDIERELAVGALTPSVQWVRPIGSPNTFWIVASAGPTQILDEAPSELPACEGRPPDWS